MLTAKRCLVLGVANQHSIAWQTAVVRGFAPQVGRDVRARRLRLHAQTLARHGAEVCVGFQTERLRGRVESLVGALPEPDRARVSWVCCDVRSDEQVAAAAQQAERWDGLVHSIAFASTQAMRGGFLDVSADDFAEAHRVSAHSFVAVARHLAPRLSPSASLVALSYLGAQRASAAYGTMGPAKASLEACARGLAVALGPRGVRVNTVSAGPVNTAAARGIPGFQTMLEEAARRAPLGRTPSVQEVANVVAFLCSDLSTGVSGQNIFGAPCTPLGTRVHITCWPISARPGAPSRRRL